MKTTLRYIYILVSITTVLTVIMDPSSKENSEPRPEHLHSSEPHSFNEALRSCLAERAYGTWECVNRGALSTLQSWNEDECLDLGGIQLERSEGQSRNILDFDWDTKDFGNVLRAASRLLERRNMRWDLGFVYPGLQMRVGPTLSAGNGMVEFVMDERSGHHYHDRQLGAGRLLIRQLVLPFLLGFKFNLAALLPLLFGALIVITKKALLLTKVALLIAGLLGWNSLFSGFYGASNVFAQPGYGQAIPATNFENHDNYQYLPYKTEPGAFPFGQHVIREIVNVYDTASQEAGEQINRKQKNFVWARNES